jgi:signal transduction histidine kinase
VRTAKAINPARLHLGKWVTDAPSGVAWGRVLARYALSVGAVVLATCLRVVLDPLLGDHHPFTIYFAAVAVTAWYAGFGPALLAICLAYFAADWFFITPRFQLNLPHFGIDEFIALVAFLFSSLVVAYTIRSLHKTRAQLQEYAHALERRVEQRTAHLQETIQSLESVCYHIAHDLRAPLRAMQGFTTLLLTEYAPKFDAKGVAYANRISEAAGRMDILIQGLLEYGQLGHDSFPPSTVHLQQTVTRVVAHFKEEIERKGATVNVRGPFPEISANESLLERVFTNLLSNALKFAKASPQVDIWAEDLPGVVRICFQDNGIGIPSEYVERLFRVFERLHAGKEYPGTGIGLAIASKAAERLGGRIGVKSAVNQGSCFWLEVPTASSAGGDGRSATTSAPPSPRYLSE